MVNYYDGKALGRYPARVQSPAPQHSSRTERENIPMFLFFDGKSFTPYDNKRGVDLFSGYGMSAATLHPGRLQQTDWDWARAYIQCEYAFRAVEMVASDIASIPHGVRRRANKQDWPDHPLMQALAWARTTVRQDIISLWQKALYIFGESYLLPISNGFTDPQTCRPYYNGLQWLNPLVTEPYILGGELIGYDYSAYGMGRFPKGAIVNDKVSSMFDDIRGQSRISAALAAVNIDIEIKRYTLDSFLKDMRMSGILTGAPNSQLSQDDVDAALEIIKEKRESRLIALAPALVWQQVQHEWNDSQFKAGDDARRRITTGLGIPMSVVGAWDDAKYQSAPAQLAFYYDHVVFREEDRMKLFIDEVLMPYFDPWGEGEWWYDKDAVMTLVEDKAAKSSMYTNEWSSGGRSHNEYRTAIGLEPLGVDGDVFNINGQLVSKAALIQIGSQQAPPLLPDAMPALAAPSMLPQLPALTEEKAVEPVEQPGMKSATLTLTMPNHPDLISLQSRVKEIVNQLMGDIPCEWNTPDDFHVTLLYLPVVTDEQLEALTQLMNDVEIEDMPMRVGSLGVFDNVGQHALHFKIRQNTELYALQSELYDLCQSLEIPIGSYYQPGQFIPHITVGYTSQPLKRTTFNSKLKIKASTFCLKSGDVLCYNRALDAQKSVPVETAAPPAEPQTIHEAALEELSAWQKNARNKGAKKSAEAFQHYLIRDEVAQGIRAALIEAGDDKPAVKAVFDRACEVVAYKAIQATRIDFEDAFDALLGQATAGKITRSKWSSAMRNLINVYGNKAFRDGLADTGIDDEPDESEQDTIAGLIRAQASYITGLGDKLFQGENPISAALAEQKAAMWYSGSIAPFYSAGVLAGDANSLYVWNWGNTEEHCEAEGGAWGCKNLDGTAKRYKTWDRLNLIAGTVGQNTTCGGFLCDCKLKRKAGKSSDIVLGWTHYHHVHEPKVTPALVEEGQ